MIASEVVRWKDGNKLSERKQIEYQAFAHSRLPRLFDQGHGMWTDFVAVFPFVFDEVSGKIDGAPEGREVAPPIHRKQEQECHKFQPHHRNHSIQLSKWTGRRERHPPGKSMHSPVRACGSPHTGTGASAVDT